MPSAWVLTLLVSVMLEGVPGSIEIEVAHEYSVHQECKDNRDFLNANNTNERTVYFCKQIR